MQAPKRPHLAEDLIELAVGFLVMIELAALAWVAFALLGGIP